MRYTIIAGILLLWAGALVALFRHDLRPMRQDPPVPVEAFERTDVDDGDWWGVYLQGHKVGFVHHVLVETKGGLSFRDESVLILNTLGVKQTIRTQASGEMAESFAIQHLEFSLVAGPTRLEVEATARDEILRVTIAPSGETIDLKGPVSLPLGLRAAAMKSPLEAGRTIRGLVFDPLTRTSRLLSLRVRDLVPLPGQQNRNAWRITETWRDVESVLWVDEEGHLLREEGPMGLVAVREPKWDAVRILPANDSEWDAVEAVSLPVDPPIENPRERETLRVRLFGVPRERIPIGDGQSVDDSGVLIERVHVDQLQSYSLPYTASEHVGELAPTSSLQSDHPRILALTKTIIGAERDALAVTQLLVDWVFRYLHKIPTASLPNALEVLDMGQGDCNEHSVLLTALARSAGLPARVVSGIVYADGAFLYHAWTDVWIGRWVPVDSALNQMPADATHIRLTIGDQDQLLMMGMLGQLSIAIEDAAPRVRPDAGRQ